MGRHLTAVLEALTHGTPVHIDIEDLRHEDCQGFKRFDFIRGNPSYKLVLARRDYDEPLPHHSYDVLVFRLEPWWLPADIAERRFDGFFSVLGTPKFDSAARYYAAVLNYLKTHTG